MAHIAALEKPASDGDASRIARRKRAEVVVITGGTSGVGRALARRFARAGASVAVLARGQRALEGTTEELARCGVQAIGLSVDVADAEQVRAAADQVESVLGPIDVWINNAMTTVFGPVHKLTPAEYRRVTDVVYHGYVWGTQTALEKMRPRNRGAIVQVGSALAYRAIPLQSAYCGAKHAIRAFTDSLRSELLHEGTDVHLCMVQLPAVNTPQFRHCRNKMPYAPQPVPPIFQPEVAAEAIYYAAHHRKREIYVGSSAIKAIIGQKFIPGALDHYLAQAGWEGQFTDQLADRTRPDNLFEPVDIDLGAHGTFDGRARVSDPLSPWTMWAGAAGVRTLALVIAPLLAAGLLVRAARATHS